MDISRALPRYALVFVAALILFKPQLAAQQQEPAGRYVAGELIVQFRTGVSEAQRAAVRANVNASVLRRYDALRVERIAIPAAANPIALAQAFSANPDVEAAQPNFIREAVSTSSPDDPYYVNGSLWGLSRISAPSAWSAYGAGTDTIVVADIDTGVDYTHPDLAAHMWVNPGEVAGNGFDDDHNGYVDDVHGIDTANNDGDPADDHGHGTHTSGTFGAVSDNGTGIASVAPNVKVLACKFISAGGTGSDADAIECFNYVVAMKQRGVNVRVTSNSWGGERGAYFPSALKNAIDAAGNAGIVNVFAAGNAGVNIDVTPFDPASFTSPSIVSVAASDSGDGRAGWSNYGAVSVDLAAPGVDILSTVPGGYGYASGTSMATPHVAGVAALLLAHQPWLGVADAKDLLLRSVDPIESWNGLVATAGRLNAYQALATVPAPTNNAPSVTLTSPTSGASFVTPATISVTATAADTDGGIQSVAFFANGQPIGTSTNAPYTVQWNVTTAGSYTLTATATDTLGASATSAAVTIQVNEPAPVDNDPVPVNDAPSVTLIAPGDGSAAVIGSVVNMRATATDADGIARVDFYVGNTKVGSDATGGDGYTAQWTAAGSGWATLTARAYDEYGAVGTATVRVHLRRR